MPLFLFLLFTCSFQQPADGTDSRLYKIYRFENGESTPEPGTPCGYVDAAGDTVIPIGKYYATFNDTIDNFAVVLHQGRYVGIDRNENELFEVLRYDNGPDCVQEGLMRIVGPDGKIGYADSQGKVIVPAKFAWGYAFVDGRAKVTESGRMVTLTEYNIWESDSWYYVDSEGNRLEGCKE